MAARRFLALIIGTLLGACAAFATHAKAGGKGLTAIGTHKAVLNIYFAYSADFKESESVDRLINEMGQDDPSTRAEGARPPPAPRSGERPAARAPSPAPPPPLLAGARTYVGLHVCWCCDTC